VGGAPGPLFEQKPDGIPKTSPCPPSTPVTTISSVCGPRKVAVTDRASSMLTRHAPRPVHAPDQPTNTDSGRAKAVRVTTVPTGCSDVHAWVGGAPGPLFEQKPDGIPKTSPCPPSTPVTTISSVCGPRKVAVTDRASSMVTRHAPRPVHAPDQPTNTDSGRAKAVRVTTVPTGCSDVHAWVG